MYLRHTRRGLPFSILIGGGKLELTAFLLVDTQGSSDQALDYYLTNGTQMGRVDCNIYGQISFKVVSKHVIVRGKGDGEILPIASGSSIARKPSSNTRPDFDI